jgi:hypothetical protein
MQSDECRMQNEKDCVARLFVLHSAFCVLISDFRFNPRPASPAAFWVADESPVIRMSPRAAAFAGRARFTLGRAGSWASDFELSAKILDLRRSLKRRPE